MMKQWQITKEDVGTTLIVILLLIVIIFTYFFLFHQPEETHVLYHQSTTQTSPTRTPHDILKHSPNSANNAPEERTLALARAADCDLHPQEITDPTRFILVSHNRELPMMSLGRDANDAAGSPPISEGYTVGWFKEGPKLGSRHGKAVLTSHSYFTGTALGNELNKGLWKRGDIIKIEDNTGHNACYSYRDSLHIMVEDYTPDSSILYDDKHSPMFAMVVCSDWDPHGHPLGRMIYYADLITEPTPTPPAHDTSAQSL